MNRMIVGLMAFLVAAAAASGQTPRSMAPLAGKATDVGLGANGVLWAIGTDSVPGGKTIHRWNGTSWGSTPASRGTSAA